MKTDPESGRRTKRRTPTWSALSLNRATSPPPPPPPPLTILPPRLTMKSDAESGRRTKLRTRTWSALSLNPATSPPPPPPPQLLTTIPPRPPPPSMKDEIRKLSGEMVRYLLFRNRQKPNVPVTRTQLMRLIPSTYSRRLIGHVIAKAKKRLQSVFGLEMEELKRKRSKSRASSSGGARIPPQLCREYIVKSAIPESLLRKYVSGPAKASVRLSFALLVVAVVKLSGGEKMPEEELFTHLRRVGVTPEAEHPVFGHVGRALNALARQRYIRKERPERADRRGGGGGFVYSLAERMLNDESFEQRFGAFLSRHTTVRKQRR